MRLTWVARQAVALLVLAVILVTVSGFLEMIGAVRQATRQAKVEADLVAGGVRRRLTEIAVQRGLRSAETVAADPSVAPVLADAIGQAPSVLAVAVLSPEGVAVAHTQASRLGALEPAYAPLPEPRTVRQAVQTLRELRHGRPTYQRELTLRMDDAPFATVRVAIAGAFLWDAVRAAVSRGLWTAVIVVGLAVASGLLLARFASGRFRELERGIAALRQGSAPELPESGVDEFARLARALNLLGARMADGSRAMAVAGGAGGAGEGGAAVVPAGTAAISESDRSLWEGQSRAFQRISEIAAGLAHELGNQLQAVELQLLGLRNPREKDPDQIRRQAENATRELRSLNASVRGFLKIARLRPPQLTLVRIHDLLEETRRSFALEAAQLGVRIELETEDAPPETFADPEVLRQALSNLVRNALQALSGKDGGRIRLTATANERYVRIAVSDDGPGIPEEIREKIFDLFFTTQSEGAGVGLALVQQSIEMHGGRVLIHSGAGEGTEVVLELPRREVA